MNASQRRRRVQIEELIKICRTRGVTSFELRTAVHNRVTFGVHPDNPRYQSLWERADRINRAGLMAQLYYLLDVMGGRVLPKWLGDQGSELDGFVKGFDTSEALRTKDIGRENVDDDGSVLID